MNHNLTVIYAFRDYRKYIQKIMQLKPHISFQALAESTRINKTSLSKVMNHHVDLSEEQSFALGYELDLNEQELDYFCLMVRYARSGDSNHRNYLLKQMEQTQAIKLQGKSYFRSSLKVSRDQKLIPYFVDPYYQLVHMGLGIEQCSTQPELLYSQLGLSNHKGDMILKFLLHNNLIYKQNNTYFLTNNNMHLDKDSPYYESYRQNMLAQASGQMQRCMRQEVMATSAVFTCSQASFQMIQDKLYQLMLEVQKLCLQDQAEQLLQLNLNLLPWFKQIDKK